MLVSFALFAVFAHVEAASAHFKSREFQIRVLEGMSSEQSDAADSR